MKTVTSNISEDQILNYRSINFMEMNIEYKYELKTHTYNTPSSPTTFVPGKTIVESKYERVETEH